jgi:hypothetical protein
MSCEVIKFTKDKQQELATKKQNSTRTNAKSAAQQEPKKNKKK